MASDYVMQKQLIDDKCGYIHLYGKTSIFQDIVHAVNSSTTFIIFIMPLGLAQLE